jgi:hypothetical protein
MQKEIPSLIDVFRKKESFVVLVFNSSGRLIYKEIQLIAAPTRQDFGVKSLTCPVTDSPSNF